MQVGIFAKTFEAIGARPVFDAIRSAGYSCTQFNFACLGLPPMPDTIDTGIIESVVTASRNSGVTVAAISGTYNMIHPDTAIRRRGLKRLGVIVESAKSMGTSLVTLCTGTRDPHDQWRHHPDNASELAWRDLLIELEKAVAIAEQHEVDLGIEPEAGNVVSSAEAARRLIDTLASTRIKIVIDPANIIEHAPAAARRDLILRSVNLLADRIAIAHAKDRDEDGQVVAAGKGVVDFASFIRALRANAFDGPLITHGLKAEDASEVAAFLNRAVKTAEVRA
jgi:sugar phosphate isomerase/epimerase